MTDGNGIQATQVELPPVREAIIDQAHRLHQEVAHERDTLRREVSELKSDIAGYKVMIDALQTQLAEADSRVASMTTVRDDAVRRRAEVETVLASMLALGRAFQIKSEPLITGSSDYADPMEDARKHDIAQHTPRNQYSGGIGR